MRSRSAGSQQPPASVQRPRHAHADGAGRGASDHELGRAHPTAIVAGRVDGTLEGQSDANLHSDEAGDAARVGRRAAGDASAWRGSHIVDDGDRPRVLPVTFAIADGVVWSAIDEKPKRSAEPARLRYLARRPEAALLVDVTTTTGAGSRGCSCSAGSRSLPVDSSPGGDGGAGREVRAVRARAPRPGRCCDCRWSERSTGARRG